MNYNKIENESFKNVQDDKIENMLAEGETVLWRGKPVKKAFVLNSITNSLGFVLLWLAFDGFFIGTMIASGAAMEMLWFIIPFFLLHLLPVWIWISKLVTSFKRWQNTDYVVTNRRILLRSGFIGVDYRNIFYKDIKNVNLKVGFIDKMLNVGDIYIQCNTLLGDFGVSNNFSTNRNSSMGGSVIYDIEDPYKTLNIIQKIVLDIQTDMTYPNDLRPNENHGYRTDYKG